MRNRWILIPPFPGSNPGAPASQCRLLGAFQDFRKTSEICGSYGSVHPSPRPQNRARRTPIGPFPRPVSAPEFSISKFFCGDLVCKRGDRFDISAVRYQADYSAEFYHFAFWTHCGQTSDAERGSRRANKRHRSLCSMLFATSQANPKARPFGAPRTGNHIV